MALRMTGKPVVEALQTELKSRIAALGEKGVVPTLAFLRVGERADDISYQRSAQKKAELIGISTRAFELSAQAEEEEVEAALQSINKDNSIHACLMFLPLPKALNEERLCNLLAPRKDIDGITDGSLGAIFTGRGIGFAPSTAAACMQMLDFYQVPLKGRRVAVVGRSLVVGKPLAMMLLARHATVTIAHSRTENLEEVCREADVVVCATGRPKAYGAAYFRAGQVVLDVGINFDDEGNMCGDCDWDSVEPIVDAITPVPGGLGAVTTALTMAHVVEAAEAAIARADVLMASSLR